MKTCDICGQEFEYLTMDYNKSYCDDCWCETHSLCDNCNRECLNEDLVWSDKSMVYLCPSCYDFEIFEDDEEEEDE